MKVFSLAAVNAVISNDSYGQISIGGGGKLLDSIGYAFDNAMFTMSSAPDGGAMVAHNASRAGSINFQIEQTSPYIVSLSEFFKWCWAHPESAESTISVTDDTGNMVFDAIGVFPSKFPGNTIQAQQQSRSFDFVAAEINPQERNI